MRSISRSAFKEGSASTTPTIWPSIIAWAYARAYDTSDQRAAELAPMAIGTGPMAISAQSHPVSRIGLTGNNPLRLRSYLAKAVGVGCAHITNNEPPLPRLNKARDLA